MASSNKATASRPISLKLALSFLLLTSLSVLLSLTFTSWPSDFDPVPFPVSHGCQPKPVAPEEHNSVLDVIEQVGEGILGPEDLAYDEKEGVLYTGCNDGWIRKFGVGVAAPAGVGKVEDWVKVGGRPLGVALASDGSLIVAESNTGLLKVNKDGEVNILTDEAEGKKFKLTNGVDVSSKGIIYFTDASYKYNLDMSLLDILEGRPHGRLLSFDPSSNQTTVLLRDLYFANGVSLAPDQQSLIFCETPLWRCRRYYIEGEKKGRIEGFIESLPGFSDNIRYDGEHYLIGIPAEWDIFWDVLMRYPFLRKLKVAFGMNVDFPSFKNAGVIRVNLEGKPVALYRDPKLSFITETMASSKKATASGRISLKLALSFLLLISLSVLLSLTFTGWPSDFDPAPLPVSHGCQPRPAAPEEYDSVLSASEQVGEGIVGPEDLAYDEKEGVLYTGCSDGWIKKFRVAAPAGVEKAEDWVKVGGRPLGVALASDGSLIVAEANTGLLKVNKDGEVNILTVEAEGKKFKLTNGVDVSSKGIIYFTDASYKYNLETDAFDILEGRPHGRLLSFDPSSNQTTVLLRDLYFANGVSIAPDQQSLIFCETPIWRCRRYYIEGEKKGRIEGFIESLPGFPDNIRHDGEHYLIGLPAEWNLSWDLLMKYPLLRKLKVAFGMNVKFPPYKNAGVMKVTLEGKPVALYRDEKLSFITGGFKIGKDLYFGSMSLKYLLRIDTSKLAMKP
ncbi:hypothetical protein M5K25_017481 [Dendrobium thyrsiflorum]|uniref:Strictosidine synthase conserved region domain-containing protein n=1 Tax=Dendrobium thyrsiflorum TaxID=117978 RepID=A0ABD0UUA7_DENTH